ncbi:InlB B-repeat-containing protein [Thioalkalivibrio thiocyanodenitrificans]|uniref:InlB B-repeat-containing protein n=1 Tax=Thioalkalivibrio thiocyanodenitrificans TaxID=243063 RepID=UPI000369A711|nr:InlB B-repeat-containing protein [Thioalkalivibrio thiocyanodenitrificans]
MVSASAGDGGSVNPAMQEVLEGESANVGVSPDTGHSIFSVSGCDGALSGSVFVTAPVTAHCNVFAAFEANTYTLNLNAQGGSVTPSSQAVVYGEPTGTLPEPSRDGHNFLGWDWQPTGGSPWQASEPYLIAGDSTVYAQWDIESFMIAATAGAGGSISPASRLVEYGDTAAFTVSADVGYSVDAVTGCAGSLAGSTYTTGAISEDCAVSASFEANEYTLSFDAQGGTVQPSWKTVTFDAQVGALPTPTRDGHVFGGWNTQAGGGGATWSETTVYAAADATLYAQWDIESYTVSTSPGANGSITPASRNVEHGSSTTFTVTPDSGYSIASVTGCGGSLSGSTYTTGAITGACSVSASFEASTYTLSFDPQGGSVSPTTKSVTYGEEIGALPVPVRQGYTFFGWSTGASQTSNTTPSTTYSEPQGTTVYAQWGQCEVENWGPKSTQAGEPFNLQPSGDSALWMVIGCAPHSARVVFDGTPLHTTIGGGGVTSARVSFWEELQPGNYPLVIRIPEWNENAISIGTFVVH